MQRQLACSGLKSHLRYYYSGAFFSTEKHAHHWSNFSSFRLEAEAGLWADNTYLRGFIFLPKIRTISLLHQQAARVVKMPP